VQIYFNKSKPHPPAPSPKERGLIKTSPPTLNGRGFQRDIKFLAGNSVKVL
jgi:hypothetical protein